MRTTLFLAAAFVTANAWAQATTDPEVARLAEICNLSIADARSCLRVARAGSGWLTSRMSIDRLTPIDLPDYECVVAYRRMGLSVGEGWTPPKKADYLSWQMSVSAYLAQPFVKNQAERLVLEQDSFVHWLPGNAAEQNQALLVAGYRALLARNPMNEPAAPEPSASRMCTADKRAAAHAIADEALRKVALARCADDQARELDRVERERLAQAIRKAEMVANRLPTESDMKPVHPWKLSDKLKNADEVRQFFQRADVPTVKVGIDDAPVKIHVVLDLGLTEAAKVTTYLLQLPPASD